MKVKIELTLDVNPESWGEDYGSEGVAEVRQDVKEYVRNVVQNTEAALRWDYVVI